jgi:flavorubredoxin/flavin reductase (DIM6/NTAB) family NADH-FMN oxidoreductase RutF
VAASAAPAQSDAAADRSVIALPIEPGLVCLRGLSPKRLRFEVEYGLERGTTANSFLFRGGEREGRAVGPVLVHPPGQSFAAPFLEALSQQLEGPASAGADHQVPPLRLVVGFVNPNRAAFLRQLAQRWPSLELIASNAGAKLVETLWQQRKPGSAPSNPETASPDPGPPLPPIRIIKGEEVLDLGHGHRLRLIPVPTPRWPGALVVFEESSGLLISGKFFAAHLCSEPFAEVNPVSTAEDRRYFYDCLMAPMARQVETVVDRLDELPIRTIAPGHGPAITESWRSLLADYRRWGEGQGKAKLAVALLYASAYGNTATIADALAQGVSRTGVRVESVNCEFAPPEQLLAAIQGCDAVLIGSPTLGGHAPTPIVSALGTLLAEGDRDKPVGVFGSFGWSGEAIDLLESKLRDGGFRFAFEPIRVKFSPDGPTLKRLEETGTALARELLKGQRKQQRPSGGLGESLSNPAMLALGRVVGPLSVVTVRKGEGAGRISGAMVASWVAQASFSPPGITVAVAKDRAVEELMHVGDRFALNVLAEGRENGPMKQFLQPFPPGADRFAGLDLETSPGGQPLLPAALAWLEAQITQRMECGDHWLVYARVDQCGLFDAAGTPAVNQRRSGDFY